jgi:hypothetical protein
MSFYPYSFEAPIERHGVGRSRKVWYTVLFLPDDIAAQLPFDQHPQLRIEGELEEQPMDNAFIPAGDGRYYVIVSPDLQKAAGLKLGQRVAFRFRVGDQSAVNMPDALTQALARDAAAHDAWEALTVGRRRGLAYHVASAKTAATRDRRVGAVLAAITGNPRPGVDPSDVRRLDRLLSVKSR